MMRREFTRPGAVLALTLLAGCFESSEVGNPPGVVGPDDDPPHSSEIGNPPGTAVIQGYFTAEGGAPAFGAVVRLFPRDFSPARGNWTHVDSLVDTTDSEGWYRFPPVAHGFYNLYASDPVSGAKLRLLDVRAAGDTTVVNSAWRKQKPGALRISVPKTFGMSSGLVYLSGSGDSVRREEGQEEVLLGNLAPGSTPPIFFVSWDPARAPDSVAPGAQVVSDDTLPVGPFATLKNTRRVHLNTGEAGEFLSQNLTNFPMVIRLNGENFPFDAAKRDGSDLRFSRADGVPLLHEIDHYDSATAHAVLWVSLDTLFAARPGQSILMHWGDSGALPPPGPRKGFVFDTAYGYRMANHMTVKIPNPERLLDATPMGNHLEAAAFLPLTARVPSPWGFATDLKNHPVALMGEIKLPPPTDYTTMLWFKAWPGKGGKLMGFNEGDFSSVWGPRGRHLYMGDDGRVHAGILHNDSSGNIQRFVASTPGSFADAQWHFAAVVHSMSGLYLYLDGRLLAKVDGFIPEQWHMGRWRVGNDWDLNPDWPHAPADPQFSGLLDEPRVVYDNLSAEAIRLMYENQRPDQGLVSFTVE